jgi:ERCC4-type nuclease
MPDARKILGKPRCLPITVDTREQSPLGMPGEYADLQPGALKTGDYAIAGDDWTIERKSINDLCSSLCNGHLADQLARMRESHALIVLVVDGDKDAFAAWPWASRTKRANCAWAFGELYRLAYEYRVCVDWNPSRRWAAISVWRWLRTRQKATKLEGK